MKSSVATIGRNTRILTLGSVGAQGTSAISQFLLVAWLSPGDFGLFASASATLIVFVALTNLGEINAYLTGKLARTSDLLKTSLRVNCCLGLLGALVGVAIFGLNGPQLGVMVISVAATIPLTGLSLAWNAVAIRAQKLRAAVLGQFIGAGTKLVVGISVAATTESAIALPTALGLGAAANVAATAWMLRDDYQEYSHNAVVAVRDRFDRIRWAAQSLVQFFGAQCDYLVLSLLATPHVVGIYFLAYQATVGVSALISGPLLKSGLVELGHSKGADLHTAKVLATHTTLYVALLSSLGGAMVLAASPHFPGAWDQAGAPLVILLGSLTGRLLTPILEAQLLASGRVSDSFWINGGDIVGTSLAACLILGGDIVLVSLAVSSWKVVIAAIRCFAVFGRNAPLVALPGVASLVIHCTATMLFPQGDLVGASVIGTFGVGIVLLLGLRRFAK
ncbi:lipopolysaccharide biosynthesis protein [Janibacter anophelis]|uniref:lipopolysaccharide biosynthesis protein n=1 Tax=Janibacter anophelis TaxID=319054 RepID=UPI000B2FB3A4|nr:oligosaccharide flippase family protein [Janibacter anophelis]